MSKLVDALAKSKAQIQSKARERRSLKEDEPTVISADAEDVQILLESDSKALQVIEEPCRFTNAELEARRIIHSGHEDNQVEAAFRNLRTSVLELTGGTNASILVTSAGKDGGASFVTINLACAFGMDVKRTAVVVDCNLKNPAYYTDLIEEEGPGLTDHLDSPGIPVDRILYRSGIPRVKLVPAGENRQSRRDYFTEEATDRFLRQIKRRYRERYLFLDSPPINESADTRALVKLCDYVILVIPYGGATIEEVRKATAAIGEEKLLGVVLNNEPRL